MPRRSPGSRSLYLRLLGYVRPYWRPFALSILGLVITAATEPAVAALFKPLLDQSFVARDPQGILWMPAALVGLFLVRGIGSYMGDIGIAWVGGRVVYDLRCRLFERILSLPTAFFDQHSAGAVISKVTYDVNQVARASTSVLTVIVQDSLTVLGLLAWMLYLDWQLTLVVFVIGPVVAVIVLRVNRRLRTLSRSLQRTYGELTQTLEEATVGNRVIKVYGGAAYEQGRFERSANWVRRYDFKAKAASALNVPLVQFVIVGGLAVVVYTALRSAVDGTLTVGGFVSFLGAMGLLFAPIKRITSIAEPLQRGLAAAESVFGLLDEPPEADTGRETPGRARGHLEFRHVTFRYAGSREPALHDFSLVASPGETVALVGPSGGGKSTVANLIPRFYDVESGELLLDGRPIRELRLSELRRNIAYVGQDVVMFNDTVAANIAYGAAGAVGEAEVLEAARRAHALEFIERLPEGLQSQVGDRGVRLSGGQRQRLAIARALLRDAPVLILDEATSALDSESEREVQAALEALRHGRTTLVIAHRLSTIESADRIVVLKGGRVVESGAHRELLAQGGVYARLYEVQFQTAPG
jgi:subfamily B ATP-binding cassette protein MsbA